jgi:hypothetical protein
MKLYLFLWLLLFIALLTGCGGAGELTIATIERDSTAHTGEIYESRNPGIVIITGPEGVDKLGALITADAVQQLREMNYETHFAVIAFWGLQPTGYEGLFVDQVIHQENALSILGWVGEKIGTDEITSPYHVMQVERTGELIWNIPYHITLTLDDIIVISQTGVITDYTFLEAIPSATPTPRPTYPPPRPTVTPVAP